MQTNATTKTQYARMGTRMINQGMTMTRVRIKRDFILTLDSD